MRRVPEHPTRRPRRPRANSLISGAWLATTLGVEPRALDVRRRAGELLAVPDEKGDGHLYPMWQFGPDGSPLPVVARAVAAARSAGLGEADLYALLHRRHLTGGGTLLDALREGREQPVLDAIRAEAARR